MTAAVAAFLAGAQPQAKKRPRVAARPEHEETSG
jgi:hypothetical protein